MTEAAAREFVLDLPSEVEAASLARHFVSVYAAQLPADLAADALLLVSELVTNAVQHGLPAITLRVSLEPPLIGVAVDDAGDILPSTNPSAPSADASHGRGLMIIDQLASTWGVEVNEDGPGKSVWFHLAAARPHTGADAG